MTQDIEDYSKFIDPVAVSGNTLQWPKGPYACVWACGRDWSRYDQPVHAGLNQFMKADLLLMANTSHAQCIMWANNKINPQCISGGRKGSIGQTVKKAR